MPPRRRRDAAATLLRRRQLRRRVVTTLKPDSDLVAVHRARNKEGALRLYLASPVDGWVSERLVEFLFAVPDRRGPDPNAPKPAPAPRAIGDAPPASAAIARTRAAYNSVAARAPASKSLEARSVFG